MLKQKLLLHTCCIGCGAHVFQKLRDKYEVVLYFFNPNIYPQKEYNQRMEETKRIAKDMNLRLETDEYDHASWQKATCGLAFEPEGGRRCAICYNMRLNQAAIKAKELNCNIFATTLTISPHKKAEVINQIGHNLSARYNIEYLESNWKKQGGFQESCRLSRELNLYRQNYCGCEFSLRDMLLRQYKKNHE